MTLVQKAIAGVIVATLIGSSFWYLIDTISDQSARIGELESKQKQLVQDLEDSQQSARDARAQLEMWQWLYEDLQAGYKTIRQDREAMSSELRSLKEQQNVQDYLDCPMPDSLYDWVRKN